MGAWHQFGKSEMVCVGNQASPHIVHSMRENVEPDIGDDAGVIADLREEERGFLTEFGVVGKKHHVFAQSTTRSLKTAWRLLVSDTPRVRCRPLHEKNLRWMVERRSDCSALWSGKPVASNSPLPCRIFRWELSARQGGACGFLHSSTG